MERERFAAFSLRELVLLQSTLAIGMEAIVSPAFGAVTRGTAMEMFPMVLSRLAEGTELVEGSKERYVENLEMIKNLALEVSKVAAARFDE